MIAKKSAAVTAVLWALMLALVAQTEPVFETEVVAAAGQLKSSAEAFVPVALGVVLVIFGTVFLIRFMKRVV